MALLCYYKIAMEKVSVIIAAYNVEKYLSKAVESVINQTYQNLEILLIDDGSKDRTPQMCDDYAKRDNRIKVVHKPNGGVSSAWNAGLDNATGDFIAFVDSDDWVDKDYILELYTAIKKYNCDISVCNYYECINDKVYKSKNAAFDRFIEAKNVYDLFFSNKDRWNWTSWGKLYKKEIFNGLRYNENVACAEDLYAICDILDKVKVGIVTISKQLYYYLIRENSVTTTFSEKRFDVIIAVRHAIYTSMNNSNISNAIIICKYLFCEYRSIFAKILKAHENKKYKKRFNEMFNEDYKKYYKYLPKKQKLYTFLFKHFRVPYIFIQNIKWRHARRTYVKNV